mmetsp:Transcript_90132/g.156197  ORF Transcript_90132/g.156197 Transcript_90132/m.156197 type:complete len:87 (+) Transcript_90132:257-517(+)
MHRAEAPAAQEQLPQDMHLLATQLARLWAPPPLCHVYELELLKFICVALNLYDSTAGRLCCPLEAAERAERAAVVSAGGRHSLDFV